LLARLESGAHRILATSRQIAQRLVPLVRDGDAHQFPGAGGAREQQRIAPIGFDQIARGARDFCGAITSQA